MSFIEGVFMAEFDIDKGSVCRVQYPKDIGDPGLLAELMLPEGAHNHFQDWTVFMLNRPKAAEPSAKADGVDPVKKWPVHAYRYSDGGDDAGWVLIDDHDGAHWATLETEAVVGGSDAAVGGKTVTIVIHLGGGEILRVVHHEELQYSALQPDFVSMYSLEGDAIGLHFRAVEQQQDFHDALDKAVAAAAPPAPMLWCLNHVSNRRDSTVRRGAQVKALAVCSRYRFVHVWKPLLLLGIDRMYSLSTGCAARARFLRTASRARSSSSIVIYD